MREKFAQGKGEFSLRSFSLLLTIFVLLFLGLAGTRAFAQVTTATGSIQGVVTDPSGAVVPSAKVTITNRATGAAIHLTASSSGAYASGPLLPGDYQVRIEKENFKTAQLPVTVQVGTVTSGDVKLELGAASTIVEVGERVIQVNTVQATVQDVLTRSQIEGLPVNGRNFLDLATIEPGVQIQDGATFDPTKNGYSSVSFGGRFGRTARIEVDGVDISDETVGTTTQNIPQSAIQEFQVAQSSLGASTELTSSGTINVTTRSGTNAIHGEGFFYGRSDQLAARIAPKPLDFARKQYGANLGGPFIKDKLFFFGTWERTQQDLANPVTLTAPFSGLSGFYGAPFRDTMFLGRLDYKLKSNATLFYRFSYEQNSSVRGFNPGVYQPFLNRDHTPVHIAGMDFTTGKFSHSLRFGFTKFHNEIFDAIASSGAFNPAPGLALDIAPFADQTCLAGGESFCSGQNILAPQGTFQRNVQGKYDGTFVAGSHILHYGFTINAIKGGGFAAFFGLAPSVNSILNPASEAFANNSCGANTPCFPGGASNPLNYPVQNVLLGNGQGFFTGEPSFDLPAGGQFDTRIEWYVGDTWKVFHNLTLTYALRYVRDTGRSDSQFPPVPCSAAPSIGCTGNLLDVLGPGLGNQINQPNKNFAPQVGIAWDPTGSGKTVFRVGGGLYYENAIFNNVLFDQPGRLQTGLFFGTSTACSGGSGPFAFCGQPIGSVVNSIVAAQKAFQQATVAAGPAANGSFIGNILAEGPDSTGNVLIAPSYRTPRSWQMNAGVQHQFGANNLLTVDYVRNVGLHFLLSVDTNHVGDARFLNKNAAAAAIATTLGFCGVATINQSLAGCPTDPLNGTNDMGKYVPRPATMDDYAKNGLDSGVSLLFGLPASIFGLTPDTGAAFPGMNPNFGEMQMNFPIGRSVYNGLLVSWKTNLNHPAPGIHGMSLLASYALSRFVSQANDQDFVTTATDMNHPLRFTGPTALDRTNQFRVGGVIDFPAATRVAFTTSWSTASPATLVLPNSGLKGEIFRSNTNGDGNQTTLVADPLPGTNIGSFGRDVKTGDLTSVIQNWNATGAGQLTPAGQALVSAGLFTQAQLVALGAVTPTLALPVPGHIGLSPFFTTDVQISWLIRPSKLWSNVPERLTIEPKVAIFNVTNRQNFDPGGNVLSGVLQLACPGGPSDSSCVAPGNVVGQTRQTRTNLVNPGSASGVNWYGVPRQAEFGVRITF